MLNHLLAQSSSGWEILFSFLAFVIGIILLYYLYIGITRRMAKNRGRRPLGWILLGFIVSPMIVWIILLIVEEKR